MRKVLLLTYHFPPSSAAAVYRMLGLVRYLPEYGWQPVVVAPPRVPWEPQDPGLLAQVPPQTPVERVEMAEGGFINKAVRYLFPETRWLPTALRACHRMIREHRPDAILTSSPPGCIHLLGLWLQRRYRLPWIACFRDPWITNHEFTKWTFVRRRDRWLEKRVMQRANILVANTPLNKEGWQKAYPEHAAKIVVITNGYDPERFAALSAPRLQRDRFLILHAGELYTGRDPRPLMDAMRQLETGPETERVPIQLEFLGRYPVQSLDFAGEIARYGLQHCVRVGGQVPNAEALRQMMQADILLLLQTPEFRLGVPGKLYEYLGTGRPILALAHPDSDVGWVLRESKVLHRIAPERDVPKIKQALIELTRELQAGRTVALDTAALQQFTRQRMAQRMAECLDRCAASTPAVPS